MRYPITAAMNMSEPIFDLFDETGSACGIGI